MIVEEPIRGGLGAASSSVVRLRTVAPDASSSTVVRKTLRPVTSGRHAEASRSPRHWAWWRRELLAYRSGLLPRGEELRAPECLDTTEGTDEGTVTLEDVPEVAEDPATAAFRWARFQSSAPLPDLDWLSDSMLEQRLAVGGLDWSSVDVDPRAERIWTRREEFLARYARLPHALAHGDLGTGNLRRAGSTTVVLDWATLGRAPAGADLAYLALGSGPVDLLPTFLAGWTGTASRAQVELGYRINLVLTGASRLHWMASQDVPIPDWYVDLLWENTLQL